MKIPILGRAVDERFLNHRLRSSSTAGIVGALVGVALFEYRFYAKHIWSWDLLAVVGTIVAVKMGMMAWYLITD